jgi:hypothetical protein
MKRAHRLVVIGLGCLVSVSAVGATDPPLYDIPRIEDEIRVDAVLDEPAWQEAVVIRAAYETHPADNIPARVGTECLLMHDNTHMYAACRADDPEVGKIRAHLSDRDQAWQDDWIGFSFDTYNDERRAFQFFVNPLGVQMDGVRDDVNRSEDESWDAIWDSAGRITHQGYTLELAIPFSQLRFPRGGRTQVWGVDVFRRRPRSVSYIYASQERDRDLDCELCQISKLRGFEGVEPGRNLEVNPTLTAVNTEERDELDDPLETTMEEIELGATARWGFRPNLVLSATVNPDFSQVEADVAQLDINRRFALFFREKRPFFLEGADYFETPINAVHTRTVVDPAWGLKVTGKEGRNAFGAYAVRDEVTGLLFPGSEESDSEVLEQENRSGVFRYRRDVAANSTLGLLVTGRSADGYSNLVYGIDGSLRLGPSDTVRFQALGSQAEYPEEIQDEFEQSAGTLTDTALVADYEHDSKRWGWEASYRDVGNDFRADSGFVPRVGIRSVEAGMSHTWWGEDDDWYTRLRIRGNAEYEEDQDGNLLDRGVHLGGRYQGALQSLVDIRFEVEDEVSLGTLFPDQKSVRLHSGFWPTGNVMLGLNGTVGDRIDFDHNRPGEQVQLEPFLFWQPGLRWRVDLGHEFRRLDVEEGRLFTANLSQLNLRYQFNIRTFVRAIVQYTDVERDPDLYEEEQDEHTQELFTQLLFSYKVNARTVVFVGYSDTSEADDEFELTRASRTVFVKLGYAWLF